MWHLKYNFFNTQKYISIKNTYSLKYHQVIKKGFLPVDEIIKLNAFDFNHATQAYPI